ncbi:MAG TPA: acetyl-CoA C-acetyltransferase [Patescibacteria group bacterium]|nr:acetyl-CoA C-acetyltransferase [Patescibacteria group bacterium]
MEEVYILNCKRSAISKYGGSFLETPAPTIAGIIIKELLSQYQNQEFHNKVDKVILGNVLSAGLGQNPARIAAIQGEISSNTPAFTINHVCGSGLMSVVLASQIIRNKEADMIVAGGMENMSRSPYLLDNYRFGTKFGHQIVRDGMIYDGLFCSLIKAQMGATAENIARKYKITREDQDSYAFKSNEKALKAIDSGIFKNEIIPIKIKSNSYNFDVDEEPRRNTTAKKLSQLKPVFNKNGTVTAGNSSSISDGAAITILASSKFISQYSLKPMALIKSHAEVGCDPSYMGMGAYYAALKCIKKGGFTSDDIDLFEINEAFASQSIAVIRELRVSEERVNVNGGAIALGHPIGASGSRILCTLLHELVKQKLRYGLAALCVGGGQGIAIIVERI